MHGANPNASTHVRMPCLNFFRLLYMLLITRDVTSVSVSVVGVGPASGDSNVDVVGSICLNEVPPTHM